MNICENRLKIFFTLILQALFFNSNTQSVFVENKGQFNEEVIAKINVPSGSVFIERDKLKFAFFSSEQLKQRHDLINKNSMIDAHAYTVSFVNSSKTHSTFFANEESYFENYFLGPKSNWATNVRTYKSVHKKDLYAGIDLNYYMYNDNIKYDFIVSPNVNPSKIKILYEGLQNIYIDNIGRLCLVTSVNTIIEHKPYAYQFIGGKKEEIPCVYKLNKNILTFELPEGYDISKELIIDPVLEFSTYSGSTADNFGYTATYDNMGFLYSGSTVFGTGYPTTIGAYQINYANTSSGTDIAITKYDTTGTQRIFSTYLGGSQDELPHSMIVNSLNELFVFGTTGSADFPVTPNAFQKYFNGGVAFSPSGIGVNFPEGTDIFVTRISANGGDLYASSFIGGSGNDGLNINPNLNYNYADEVRGEIDIDKQNNVYISTCTNSTDFPVSGLIQNNLAGGQDGCVVKLDNQLTSVIWATYLGGSKADAIYSLALSDEGDIYVTGGTNSSNFPVTYNAYQSTLQDTLYPDGFVTKLNSMGTQILSSTYYGTEAYDQCYFVETGNNKDVFLFGQTNAQGLSLVKNALYYTADAGQFVTVFNQELSNVKRSTVIGTGKGSPDISPTAFLVDVCDKVYLAGWGSNLGGPLSTLNLPVTIDAHQSSTDGNDFYLMVIDNLFNSLVYATYFGGSQSNEHVDGGTSRFDKKGTIYQSVCAGCGGNSDFPTEPSPGAVSNTNNSMNCNNAVFKFNFDFPMVISDFSSPGIICDTSIYFQNNSMASNLATYFWDFGDGNTSFDKNPTHTFSQPGTYNVLLIVTDNSACNIADTVLKEVYVLSNSTISLQDVTKCVDEAIQIGISPITDPSTSYTWSPDFSLSSTNIPNPYTTTNMNQQYQLIISNGSCTDTLLQNINVLDLQLVTSPDTSFCDSAILINATYSDSVILCLWSSNLDFLDTLSLNSNLLINNPETFYVYVTDGKCYQLDSVKVLSRGNDIDVFSNDICIGDSLEISIINLDENLPIVNYICNDINYETPVITVAPNTSTNYIIHVVNNNGCVSKDSTQVQVFDYPSIDTILLSDSVVFRGEEVSLEIKTDGEIFWQDFNQNSTIQQFFPQTSSCFYFEVFSQPICSITDSVCIVVNDVFCNQNKIKIPTAFSPNNDGYNDFYFINVEDDIILKYKLEIFNRLGQKVYESTDITSNWSGTFNGELLPPQVFDFYLELECIGNKTFFHKGNITLLR
tara:strand:- start:54831 stop:58511 length:3681 start_codon:yes stop_codon:yes gene_type:complete